MVGVYDLVNGLFLFVSSSCSGSVGVAFDMLSMFISFFLLFCLVHGFLCSFFLLVPFCF
eukprot:m.106336 g.106336  ORF g.106336 m.106336 type:complete len:59 (-) comp15149_c0_seq1:928-1104(-)